MSHNNVYLQSFDFKKENFRKEETIHMCVKVDFGIILKTIKYPL